MREPSWVSAARSALAADLERASPAPDRAVPTPPIHPRALQARWLEDALPSLRAKLGRLPILGRPARWFWAMLTAAENRRVAAEARTLASAALEAARAAQDKLRAAEDRAERSGPVALRSDVESLAAELRVLESDRVDGLTRQASRARADIALLHRRLDQSSPPAAPVGPPTERLPPRWDAAIVAMSDESRGRRDDIKARLRTHLAVIHACGAGSPDRPVIDLGCGRGEWLELLGEEGLCAAGYDDSPAAIAVCHSLALPARVGEAIAVLRAQPPDSAGAITLFHVIEHLSPTEHAMLFDEALRVLAPGGLLLMETPNGENFSVSGRSFWFDPTHRVLHTPASLLRWFNAGTFIHVAFQRLHPYPPEAFFPPGEVGDRLNDWFFREQDFAMWGEKPGASPAPPAEEPAAPTAR